MDKSQLSVGILSGGKSTRMGENKALLQYKGKTFLENIVEVMNKEYPVLISVNDVNVYKRFSFEMIIDEIHDIGPIEGIRQLLRTSKTDLVFICGVDMPFLKLELVNKLLVALSDKSEGIIVCHDNKLEPLCAIYSKIVLTKIEKAINEKNYSVMEVVKKSNFQVLKIEDEKYIRMLRNVNSLQQFYEINENKWLI